MNISYFMSVLELYLSKEKEYKTNLSIIKHQNEKIKVNFTMNHDLNETTSFFVLYDTFMNNDNLYDFLQFYKKNLIIIDEKYEYDKLSEICYYSITLSNGRILSFKNFTLTEVNNIRNLVYGIISSPYQVEILLDEKEKRGYYHPGTLLGQTGFASFLALFFVIITILGVLILTLFVFKNLL